MGEEASVNALETLTRMAYQFGPFFFALLFMLWISRWGYKKYTEACIRSDPKASKEEIAAKKHYFLISTYSGLLLVGISILWWFYFNSSTHVFAGRIEGLKDYQETISSSLYIKSVYQHSRISGVPLPRQDHFVITKDKPFEEGDTFDLAILVKSADGNVATRPFEITYAGQQYIKLKYDVDESTGEPILKKLDQGKSQSSLVDFSFIKLAHAGLDFIKQTSQPAKETLDYYQIKSMPATKPVNTARQPISKDSAVAILQKERSSLPEKITALEFLLSLNQSDLVNVAHNALAPEPLVLTISDLTRHTDKEVAVKAHILFKKLDVKDFIVHAHQNSLLGTETLEAVILRLDPKLGRRLLMEIAENPDLVWAASLMADIENNNKHFTPLIPTASSSGDRYYVKAQWSKENQKTLDCLTTLFNTTLMTNRTLEDEEKLMKNRTERHVYWYSKDWAMDISAQIKSCGAKASFTGF